MTECVGCQLGPVAQRVTRKNNKDLYKEKETRPFFSFSSSLFLFLFAHIFTYTLYLYNFYLNFFAPLFNLSNNEKINNVYTYIFRHNTTTHKHIQHNDKIMGARPSKLSQRDPSVESNNNPSSNQSVSSPTVVIDGRIYHNIESSSYCLPRDEEEQDRLNSVCFSFIL